MVSLDVYQVVVMLILTIDADADSNNVALILISYDVFQALGAGILTVNDWRDAKKKRKAKK